MSEKNYDKINLLEILTENSKKFFEEKTLLQE